MISKSDDPRKRMSVPSGFFENFEDRLMEKIKDEEKKARVLRLRKITSVAAIFVLLVSAIFVLQLSKSEGPIELADISSEENWEYILENSEEISSEELVYFEEAEEALEQIEFELYGEIDQEKLLEEIELETIESFYE